jgi:protein-tyrosine phosphatase
MKKNEMSNKVKVLFVCHGNICRSTMCESVMTHLVKQHHIDHLFEIASAATSREEIGEPPHYGTVQKLRQVGIPVIPHRAVQMTKADYAKYDYLIGMDTANIRNMNRIVGSDSEGKIYKLLSFVGSGADVADPWYTGDFDATYRDVLAGCEGLIRFLQEQGKI